MLLVFVHFAPEMWEKPRVDGKRILKHHALPNIFKPISETVFAFKQNNEITQSVCQTVEMIDTSDLTSDKVPIQIVEEPIESPRIAVTHNQPNSSLCGLECETYWKKQYEKLSDLFKKCEKTYNSILKRYNKFNKIFKEKVKRLNTEKIRQFKHVNKLYSIIKKVFTDDQIKSLVNKSTHGCKWSEHTIKKSIRLRIACGVNGYKELLQQHIPLSSVRTLKKRLETLHFEEGICEGIIDILKEKIKGFDDERNKDAMIALDEMSITSGNQFDPSTKVFCGNSSLLNSKGNIDLPHVFFK